MLQIIVEADELFNEATNEFVSIAKTTLNLEHSLVSISKWESRWHKAFFSPQAHTDEETRDYIRCMTTNHNVDPNVYKALSESNINDVVNYIEDPMSAIRPKKKTSGGRSSVVSEQIYYWMVAYNIPLECEKWHITRLLNLIDICDEANKPKKKRSSSEIAREYASLNAQRCAALHTRG